MSDLVRMCVSLEQSLFDQVERITEEGEFTNRSEMVRDLVRQRLNCEDFDAETIVIATLTLIYDHHERNLSRKLHELQHKHHANVLASTHIHLSHDICAEMVMMRGEAGDVTRLSSAMRNLKGVKSLTMNMCACMMAEKETHAHS